MYFVLGSMLLISTMLSLCGIVHPIFFSCKVKEKITRQVHRQGKALESVCLFSKQSLKFLRKLFILLLALFKFARLEFLTFFLNRNN